MKFLLGLATLASVAFADITFNVVGYPSTPGGSFGVSINGAITKLIGSEATFPVWVGAVPGTTSAVEYSYVELSAAGATVKTEPFVRKLINATHTKTQNEFFERQITTWELPKLPYTYLATYPSKTKAFKQKQIATIHLIGSTTEMDEMNNAPKADKDYRVTFRFINSDTIYTQHNISLQTAGKSSKEHSKQSFKFKFDTDYNQTFFSRPNIKLRSMVQDPTMMREKLYIDVLNSVGVPTQQGAWVRLFVNSKPYGLYLMVDDIKKSFLKQTIHAGDATVLRGSLIQMNAWQEKADLVYKGPATANYCATCYQSQSLGQSPINDPLWELIAFMKDLHDFNPTTTPDPIGYWNTTRMDLDIYLRSMALEYLMGAFDMHWHSGSNYFMYRNPRKTGPNGGGKWQWIPTDMDGTFGSGYPTSTIPSYKTWTNFADTAQGARPLIQKLILQNAEIRALFEQTLKEIVSTVFKPEAMAPRAIAYNQMLSADAKWDTSLVRPSTGINNNFTFEDFNNNLNATTKDMQSGVLPWIKNMSDVVAKELAFQIPAGVADRVAPPPKKGDQGNPEDEEDDVLEGPGGSNGNGDGSGSGNGNGNGNGASQVGATLLQAILVASLALFLL
ncbi:hypothetical protein BGX23_006588 [Mortierella sp. AD031]|nr:hypothetical protein BGX23_006588 [Mortierella sp. AD031]